MKTDRALWWLPRLMYMLLLHFVSSSSTHCNYWPVQLVSDYEAS